MRSWSENDYRTEKLLDDDKIVKMLHTEEDASEDLDDEYENESTLEESRVMINSNHFLRIL